MKDLKIKGRIEHLLDLYKDVLGLNFFTNRKSYEHVQNHLREIFGISDLVIGVSIFFQKGDKRRELIRLMMLDHQYKSSDIKQLYRDAIHYSDSHYKQSIYFENANAAVKVIEDLTKYEKKGINYWLMRRGVQGMVLVPLRRDFKLIGFLELTSTSPIPPSELDLESVRCIVSLFTNLVSSFTDCLKAELHSLIQKNFTAIHPAVEWMFEDLAIEWLKGEEDSSINSPIWLEEVYCLYGNSDIRGSSELRRSAIQEDLYLQIHMAEEIVRRLYDKEKLAYYEYLQHRLRKFQALLRDKVKVTDEHLILNFLNMEVEPLIQKSMSLKSELQNICKLYYENVLETGGFYKNRKKFEKSVHNLNIALNTFVSEEQKTLQKIYPHFFEKHITDGIEHSIFVGSRMDMRKNFTPLHLKSLKLWQLKLLSKAAYLGERVKENLSLKLNLAHLVVSQMDPVTIYFDLQEKKFKVEGTYNIRFEIVKKRIDKALIKNTQERLTQPGTIAVVYSVDNAKEEYIRYFEYLHDAGFIKKSYGDYLLEDMQGVEGLRALRVEVDLERLRDKIDLDLILENQDGFKK